MARENSSASELQALTDKEDHEVKAALSSMYRQFTDEFMDRIKGQGPRDNPQGLRIKNSSDAGYLDLMRAFSTRVRRRVTEPEQAPYLYLDIKCDSTFPKVSQWLQQRNST